MYPSPYTPITMSQEQLESLINRSVSSVLQQYGFQPPPPPLDMAKWGADVLVGFGNHLSEEQATYFKDNMSRFVSYIQSEQGKEMSLLLIEDFKSYK